MSYLLRVTLPDRPGSLGSLAVALGSVGADILSLDVIERSPTFVVDDIVVDLGSSVMPDVLITAAEQLEGVHVNSLRPYVGGLDANRELELIDEVGAAPAGTQLATLVEGLPKVARTGWALIVQDGTVIARSGAAPESPPETMPFLPLAGPLGFAGDEEWVPEGWKRFDTTLAAAPLGRGEGAPAVLVGRPGGPDFRPSEVARLGYLAGILASVLR